MSTYQQLKAFFVFLVSGALLFASIIMSTAFGETLTASEAAALYKNETTYSIYRKGKKIGKHSLKITSKNNRINVSVDSRITVRVLKIPVFRFSYLSEEIWENELLLSVDSTTTTNKAVERATLVNKNGSSNLTNNNGSTNLPTIAFATNHWHIGAVGQSALFNTVKGTLGNVTVTKITNEELQIGEVSLTTTHYKYDGDIIAQSWYDENNRWVKLAFLGSDGSLIKYEIDTP